MNPHLVIDNLSHHYGQVETFRGISLSLSRGESFCLLGPSGCGKSTFLQCLAGIERPSAGDISIAGQSLGRLPPEARSVGLVFQDYCLFPHLNVAQNIGFGLHKLSRKQRRLIVAELVELVGLQKSEKKFPKELAGGECQRVAIARALAPSPQVLLFDEAFSHLDRNLRLKIIPEVKQILTDRGVTSIFITHDQQEAFDCGERIAVLQGGTIHQVDDARGLYETPHSAFVAQFVGSGFFLPGFIPEKDAGMVITQAGSVAAPPGERPGPVEVYLPAGRLKLGKVPADHALKGQVVRKWFRREHFRYDIQVESIGRTYARLCAPQDFALGETVFLHIDLGKLSRVFRAESRASGNHLSALQ